MIYIRTWQDRAEHQKQAEAAKELLLAGLRLEFGFDVLPEISRRKNGKPYFTSVPDVFFNYSHCRAGVLCGISRSEIGVDMENVRDYRPGFAARVCHAAEHQCLKERQDKQILLTRIWTAKEAYLKYTGEGIRRDLRELDMSKACFKDEMEQNGCYLRFWREEDIILCVCGEHTEDFVLKKI